MWRSLLLIATLAVVGVSAALAYHTLASERDYRALMARGDAALGGDQTFSAIEAYSGAIALRPDSILPHLRRGETYARRGDLPAAAHDFRAAASLDPSAIRPLDELGDALYDLERYARAAEAYEVAWRIDDRSPRLAYKLALARFRSGAVDDALAAVNQSIRLDDRSADAQYLLGLCLRARRRSNTAEQALQHAVTIEPGFIAAREELADLYRALGRHADEIQQLQLLAGLDREHIERQVDLGLADARAGHPDAAVLTLGSALERSPGDPLVNAALGEVWLDAAAARSDSADLAKALEALGRVAWTANAGSRVLTLYGRALLQNDQAAIAEDVLEQATARYPIDPEAFVFHAAAAEKQRHLEAARRSLLVYDVLMSGGGPPSAGSKIDDAKFPARAAHIGLLSLAVDDAETAVGWLQRAAAASPNDASVLASLADAQIRTGDPAAANATIARGLERDPTNARLRALAGRTAK